MQSLTKDGYSEAQVIEALHASGRRIRFSYDLLSSEGENQGKLDGVQSGRIDNNSLATNVKRTAKFTLTDFQAVNYLSDRIRPNFHLIMTDGKEISWPLGVFLLSTPVKNIQKGIATREIEAYDQLLILLDDRVEDRYVVDASTNYISAVTTLLESAGVTDHALISDDRALSTSRDWAPGTPKLRIINHLLTSINYGPLFFNAAGVAISQPYQSPSDRGSGYTYEVGSKSILVPEVSIEFDLFSIPNKWVAYTSEVDKSPINATYTNTEPSSITSTVSRGRTIVDFREVDMADQTSLNNYVERIAFEASQVYEIANIKTALMPHHENAEVLRLTYPGAWLSGKYSEHTWSMELKAGASMEHKVRRVVTI